MKEEIKSGPINIFDESIVNLLRLKEALVKQEQLISHMSYLTGGGIPKATAKQAIIEARLSYGKLLLEFKRECKL